MPSVTLKSGKSFPLEDGESILDGALRAGVLLPHSCKTGRCSSCRVRVNSGQTRELTAELGLDTAERGSEWILSCCRTAANDIALEQSEVGRPLPPPRLMPAKIDELCLLTPDLLRLRLRLPPHAGFEFAAGQYVELATSAGLKRSYSVASGPPSQPGVEFLIRRVNGGQMSDYWFDQAKPGDLLRVHGPRGTFFVREPWPEQVIFLATGTGIAPVQAMLQAMATAMAPLPRVAVFWGNRELRDFVVDPRQWLPGLQYVPVLSRPDDAWQGARGHIQAHFASVWPSLAASAVYACGSPDMIKDSRAVLDHHGLPESQFFADAFVCSA